MGPGRTALALALAAAALAVAGWAGPAAAAPGGAEAARARAVPGVRVTRPRRVAPQARSLGPNVLAGRVRGIVPRADRPERIVVASATGGIWQSDTGGSAWAPVDDWLPSLTFSALAADPQDPDTLYAGTGEVFTFLPEALSLRGQDPGGGILRSADGGRTWRLLEATRTPDFRYVNRLAVHPADGRVVLAATTTGLFRSADGGATWAQVRAGAFLDVRFHPADGDPAAPGRQVDAVAGTADSRAFVALGNGGAAFDQATLPAGLAGNQRIEVEPSASEPGVWHAAHVSANGLILLRSADRGRTFTARATPPAPVDCTAPAGSTSRNNRRYSGALWVSPVDPALMMVGGIKLCRSTDGGATFSQLFPGAIHDDHHVIVASGRFAADGAVYVGNDGGVYRIDGVAGPAPALVNLNAGLAIQQFHGAAMSPRTGVLIGGTQDNGTLRRAPDGAWTSLPGLGGTGSDGITAVTDPADGNLWFFGKSRGRVRRSLDGGVANECLASASAQPVTERADDGACPPAAGAPDPTSRCFNLTPFALDLGSPDVLYIGCASLWRTRAARGPAASATFAPVMAPSGNHQVAAFAQAPSDRNVMWLGTLDTTDGSTPAPGHRVLRTGNLQADAPAFDLVEDGATLPARPVTDVAVRPADADRVFVALSGNPGAAPSGNLWRGVRSPAGAVAWTDVSAGLPPGPVWSVATHPTVARWLYAGTEAGVYVSHDDGATWSATSRGPANVPVADLTWVDDHRLIVATYGRGVFEFDETPDPETVLPERAQMVAGIVSGGHVEDTLRQDDRGLRMQSRLRLITAGPVTVDLTGRTGFPGRALLRPRLTGPGLAFTLRAGVTRPLPRGTPPALRVSLLNGRTRKFEAIYDGPVQAGTMRLAVPKRALDFVGPGGALVARLGWTGVRSATVDLAAWRITRS